LFWSLFVLSLYWFHLEYGWQLGKISTFSEEELVKKSVDNSYVNFVSLSFGYKRFFVSGVLEGCDYLVFEEPFNNMVYYERRVGFGVGGGVYFPIWGKYPFSFTFSPLVNYIFAFKQYGDPLLLEYYKKHFKLINFNMKFYLDINVVSKTNIVFAFTYAIVSKNLDNNLDFPGKFAFSLGLRDIW